MLVFVIGYSSSWGLHRIDDHTGESLLVACEDNGTDVPLIVKGTKRVVELRDQGRA